MTIDSDNIDTGVNTAVTDIVGEYLTGGDVLSAMYGDLSGLDIDADTATVLSTDAINNTAQWDTLTAADSGKYTEDAVRDFISSITANSLAAQKSLALAFTTTIHDDVAISGSVEDAVAAYFNGTSVGAYVEKSTGNFVVSETTLSRTTYIPIGDYLVGAGKAVEAFAIYETLKDTISDSYHATLGDEQAAFDAGKDYLIAASSTLAGGAAAADASASGEALQALAFSAVGGLTGWATDSLSTSLATIIHDAKVDGKTEAETLAIVKGEINDTINSQWTTTSTAAENMLDSVHDLVGTMYDGVQGLVEGNGWCPNPPLPAALTGALASFADGTVALSPLVIDLSSGHTGVELTTFNASTTTTFFDLNNTGFAQQTAWMSGDTGLLVRDLNSNGIIDNGNELFGSATVDGFSKLAVLDSNGDLKIDSHDSAWSSLSVWVDSNGDAVTQPGELHSLSSLGIASIDLAGVAPSTDTIDGNAISHTSTVTFTDDSSTAIADAWFVTDPVNSYYNGDYTLDTDTLFLPDLRGYGTIAELSIAMSQDSTLKGLVSDFASGFTIDSLDDPSTLNTAITNIMYEWGGVSDVDPASRGGLIDARNLEFLEHIFGQSFVQLGAGSSSNPYNEAAGLLEHSWDLAFSAIKSDLLLQTGLGDLFGGTVTYNPSTGNAEGTKDLNETAVDALAGHAPSAGASNDAYWVEIATFLDNVKGLDNLTSTETGWLNDTVNATDSSLSWSNVVDLYDHVQPGLTISGTTGNDTLTGTTGDDIIIGDEGNDTVNAGYGNDTVYGGNGSDILNGDDGNDTIYGGTGFYAGTGNDVIHGGAGDDLIYIGADASTAYGDAGNDTIYGGQGDNTIYGGDGNDTIYGYTGNDTFYGGAGGNILYGGTGVTSYVFGGGDDLIINANSSSHIVMPSGVVSGDLSFTWVSRDGSFDDLLITVASGGSIQIENQAIGGSYQIDTVVFNDASTLDLTALTNVPYTGTNGDDSIYVPSGSGDVLVQGLGGNDTITVVDGNNTLDGGVGNDTLNGGTGDDTYIASPGFDKISDAYGGTDTINVPSAYTLSDVTFSRHIGGSGPDNDLIIDIRGLGEIQVENQFYSSDYAVENLHFLSDNSTISLTDQVIQTIGTTGDDTIYGLLADVGGNYFDGRGGNDTLIGGAGDNTFVFSSGGFGNSIVEESSTSGTNAIHLLGVDPAHVHLSTDSYGGLILIDTTDASHSITIDAAITGSGSEESAIGQYLSEITFDDIAHTVWDITGGLTLTGDNSGDNLFGTAYNDTITGGTGNDSIYGNGGDDTLLGGGGGNDAFDGGSGTNTVDYSHASAGVTVNLSSGTTSNNGDGGSDTLTNIQNVTGSSHNDTITGDSNDNVLYGAGGNDSLTGGSGADTFLFKGATAFTGSSTINDFNTGQGDKIDIADVLQGHYNPLTDAISNFVQLTTSGSNTLLKIDLDGTGMSHSPTTIATIEGITGLSLSTLITDHHLIIPT